MYTIFSDASVMKSGTGIACIVTDGSKTVVRQYISIIEKDSTRAELEGMIHGLREVPDNSDVLVFSDLNDIVLIVAGRVSYSPKLADKVEVINKHMGRMRSVEFRRVQDQKAYKTCHRMARHAASHPSKIAYKG